MRLAVDANVIISALISAKGETARLLLFGEEKPYSPEFVLEELDGHAEMKAGRLPTMPVADRLIN